MSRLKGKTALVTGASQGIGLSIAQMFVSQGTFVYLTDINNTQGPDDPENWI